MSIKMLKAALVGLILSVSSFANAGLIELNAGVVGPAPTGTGAGAGYGRGVSFFATEAFSVDSIGFEADLLDNLFEIVIWGSTDGHQVTSELASNTYNFGDTAFGWNDMNFAFNFVANTYYAVGYRLASGAHLSGGVQSLQYHNDSTLPFNIANPAIRLIDGFEGKDADNFSNSLHGSLRMNVVSNEVPEPSTLAIFALGIMGLASRRFKKQS